MGTAGLYWCNDARTSLSAQYVVLDVPSLGLCAMVVVQVTAFFIGAVTAAVVWRVVKGSLIQFIGVELLIATYFLAGRAVAP